MAETEGGRRLREWIDVDGHPTQMALAPLLGVTQSTVSGWLNGAVPRAVHLFKIAEVTGIAPELWAAPADKTPSGTEAKADATGEPPSAPSKAG